MRYSKIVQTHGASERTTDKGKPYVIIFARGNVCENIIAPISGNPVANLYLANIGEAFLNRTKE